MDDLFEKLKAEPPVNKSQSKEESQSCKSEPPSKKICKEDISASPLREKSASPVFTLNESRSNSPISNKECCKVSADVINLDDSSSETQKKIESSSKNSDSKEAEDAAEAKENPKKQMPTKAQQKLFEIPVTKTVEKSDAAPEDISTTAAVETKDVKVKRCRVRIKRENLIKLRENFAKEQASRKSNKKNNQQNKESSTKALQKAGSKRKADAGGSPPTKKGKNDAKSTGSPPGKKAKTTGFFIKLGNNMKKSPTTPKEKQSNTAKTSSLTSKEKVLRRPATRVVNSTPVYTTKATKFTRTQLIRTFGKRYFNSRVRIERCKHPMMLTFESNARARKLKAKNKSKNLSVSFKEQVEIIGLSDTESYESDEASTPKGAEKLLAGATPLHLKKVENGKVIDDIEFDPSLFGDPNDSKNSSTPLRKKKEKKSYSPLKDDSSPSARSELLKLANEKLPPSALRLLSAEDEDDEDDECEWIVPIDIPERRSSRTNSVSEKDGKTSSADDNDQSAAASAENVQTDIVNKDKPKEKCTVEETKADTSDENKSTKQVNGKEVAENGKILESEGKSKNQQAETLSDDISKCDFPRLSLENESNSATPNPPFTPENHGTPDSLVKTVIDKLSEDIEKSGTDRSEMSGLNAKTVVESA